jgi:hypothetical protein
MTWINLKGDECTDVICSSLDPNAVLAPQNGAANPARCVCDTDYVKTLEGDQCTLDCNATNEESLNLIGDQCVIECPTNAEVRINSDGKAQCFCKVGFF